MSDVSKMHEIFCKQNFHALLTLESSFVVKNALLAFTKDALLCYTKYLGWSGDKVPDSRIRLRKHNLRLAGCSNRRWVGTILQDSVHLYKKKKHRAVASQA